MKVMANNAQDTALIGTDTVISKAECANNDAESALIALGLADFERY